MNIHEYQAKAVLKEFGVPVSRGVPVLKVEDAEAAAKELGGPLWVVKSQIHAGGRGKGKFKEAAAGEKGGVRLAKSVEEVKQFCKEMLQQHAGHHPDRPRRQAGQPPLYRGRLRHREGILPLGAGRPRDLARLLRGLHRRRHGHRGSRAIRLPKRSSPSPSIRPPASCRTTAAPSPRRWACRATSPSRRACWSAKLYKAFVAKDMAMLEINPLIVSKQGELKCLDAKVSFDSNALYRQPEHARAARRDRGRRQGNRSLQI